MTQERSRANGYRVAAFAAVVGDWPGERAEAPRAGPRR